MNDWMEARVTVKLIRDEKYARGDSGTELPLPPHNKNAAHVRIVRRDRMGNGLVFQELTRWVPLSVHP